MAHAVPDRYIISDDLAKENKMVINIKKYLSAPAALMLTMTVPSSCNKTSKSQNTDNLSSQTVESSDVAQNSEYKFETKTHQLEIEGSFYQVYNKQIRFNYLDRPYEEWLSYVSPYDEYVPMLYSDESGYYTALDTVAFAIRYAYENGIEELEFPVEYDSALIDLGWQYAGLSFPDVPMTAGGCEYKLTENGYYRLKLSDSVLKSASHTDEVITAAREIVESIPPECTTDADKAYYLYDWVCTNVAYDEYHVNSTGMVNNEPQSVYGAIVKKRAVCDGIASAIQLLFNMADIDCGKVDADAISADESGHVWNFAYIGDEVWDFDATWDLRNYCETEGNELTSFENPEYYKWFGTTRSTKLGMTNLNDNCIYFMPPTEKKFSADSPAAKCADILVNITDESDDIEYIYDGKSHKSVENEKLKDLISKNGNAVLKFNDPYLLEGFDHELELYRDPIYEGKENSELVYELDLENCLLELR